jgi:hypothetical protein
LAGTLDEIILHRRDANTLEVLRGEGFMQEQFNRIYRGEEERVARGDKVLFDGLEVQASRVNERGEPTGVLFRFRTLLESPDYAWVRWHDGHYVPFVPPAVGSTLLVRGR